MAASIRHFLLLVAAASVFLLCLMALLVVDSLRFVAALARGCLSCFPFYEVLSLVACVLRVVRFARVTSNFECTLGHFLKQASNHILLFL